MLKRNRFYLFFILILTISLITQAVCSADDFVSSRVKDISDRSYEEAVIALLDNAQNSIVISMYSISLGTNTKNPVKLLLNDLLEARERGVEVTLYLNTRFRDSNKGGNSFIGSPIFKKLENAGVVIHFIPSNRRLHDKLIVVDSRYIVEGSANWSISALKNNFESSTLIDSPDLAQVKLSRLKNLLISSAPRDEKRYTPAYIESLPKSLTVPGEFLLNKKYLSRMVTSYDKRSMELYLLLLAHSQATGKQEFLISLEAMALSLGMPDSWTDTALRRQVIKTLRKLQKRYRLIEVSFFHSRDAKVMLTDIPGNTF
ncbi:MAG: phospholipase D-like domain-containing protein, partial [Omnitrophica bacterium]|nr:phospholipase D-like domain-containing protein [Candidatus Omnitrophota bacterium]